EAVRLQYHCEVSEVDSYSKVIGFAIDNPDDPLAQSVPVRRLQDELTNRRQYLAFLESFQSEVAKSVDQELQVESFQSEVAESVDQVSGLISEYDGEIEELTDLVGRKSAVPKEKSHF
ncbi:hypothetical protein T484DRAFT_1817234, partial [Baffinella frigidus]